MLFRYVGGEMEMRHLRYFVAVAETGSLTLAAEERLHTSQPSLSRQIRDLEEEVGVPLLRRSTRGVELTAAGEVFLEHARGVLGRVDEAVAAARRVGHPVRPCFALGFLTGHEVTWAAEALAILRDELPEADVMISSQTSPQLAMALRQGRVDAAVMRREEGFAELSYAPLVDEPLMVFLPSDHRLAGAEEIAVEELVAERFLNVSATAPVLRRAIDGYLKAAGVELRAEHEADNLAAAMSLIASTRSVAILPVYARNFMPWAVTWRPLAGVAPTIDLVVGYRRESSLGILQVFLARLGELAERVSGKGTSGR